MEIWLISSVSARSSSPTSRSCMDRWKEIEARLTNQSRATPVTAPEAIVRGGRTALSIYRARERFDRFTLIDVELKTGRTHQIRVHLAWIKHPVVGDETYGSGRDNTVADRVIRSQISKIGRQFLHAEKLGLTHPKSGERLNFTSPLATDLQKLLDAIRSA